MKTNYKQSQAAPHAKPIFTVSRNDSTLYVLPAYLAGAVMIRLQHIADGDKVKKLCCKVKNDRLMAMEQDVPQGNVTLTAVDIISPEKCAEKGYRKDGYGYVRTLLVTPTAEHRAMFSITCTLGERDMPISALKAYQIERIYADMREPDAKRTYCVTATELDKIRKEKGMTYKVLAEKAGLCIDTVQIACKGCRVSLESVDKMAKVLQCAVDKAFKLEVRKSPYSSTTINGVHRFLRAVCHYAEKHKLLTDNPIDAVRAPKIDAEIYVFSEEESARFIRAVMREKDIRVKTALLILIYLGLRKGELCGLTWGSVDLGKGIVHVAQQLKEKSGEGLILGKLKTKESKADLPLSPMLAEVLAEYRQWWNEHKAMYGDAWRGEWECLFVGDDGTPLNPSTINEWLDKLTERNGLPHVTVHSLRHLCATLLIRTHADPKTVQTILRHANVSTTLNIYAKVFDSTQMEAIGRVQASLENMLKESCSSSAQV